MNRVKCDKCDGTGKAKHAMRFDAVCKTCDGTGKVMKGISREDAIQALLRAPVRAGIHTAETEKLTQQIMAASKAHAESTEKACRQWAKAAELWEAKGDDARAAEAMARFHEAVARMNAIVLMKA